MRQPETLAEAARSPPSIQITMIGRAHDELDAAQAIFASEGHDLLAYQDTSATIAKSTLHLSWVIAHRLAGVPISLTQTVRNQAGVFPICSSRCRRTSEPRRQAHAHDQMMFRRQPACAKFESSPGICADHPARLI